MQNVDLYLPELRPKKEWITAWSTVWLAFGFIIILSGSSIFNYFQLEHLQKNIELLQNQNVLAKSRVDAIKGRSPEGNAVKLDREINALRLRVDERLRVNELIEGQSLGNDVGFSTRLNALANAVNGSVSVGKFRFSRGASFIEMTGESKSAEDVANLIGALKGMPEYHSATFGELTIKEMKKSNTLFVYSLGFTPLFDYQTILSELKND